MEECARFLRVRPDYFREYRELERLAAKLAAFDAKRSRFAGGASGHAHRSFQAHEGLNAKLKSSTSESSPPPRSAPLTVSTGSARRRTSRVRSCRRGTAGTPAAVRLEPVELELASSPNARPRTGRSASAAATAFDLEARGSTGSTDASNRSAGSYGK